MSHDRRSPTLRTTSDDLEKAQQPFEGPDDPFRVRSGTDPLETPRSALDRARTSKWPRLMSHLPTYSLSWWLMPMTTLGLSTLLSSQRSLHDFAGLKALGLIIYFLGLVQYVFVFLAQLARFVFLRGEFVHALGTSEETMFAAAFVISCYGVLAGAADFAEAAPGSPLSYCFIALFWIYMSMALVATVSLHLVIFDGEHLRDSNMTPAWLLPVLPTILVGVLAGNLSNSAFPNEKYALLVAGTFCSGFGFLVSLSFWAIFIHRLFVAGLPDPDKRPGMMIAVGPASYAPLAWLKLISAIPDDYGYFSGRPIAGAAIEAMTLLGSIAAVGVGLFFMAMAFISVIRGARRMSFHLTWYGLIFPNVGLLEAIGEISLLLPSAGMGWVISVATVLLVALWLFVFGSHIRWMILYNIKEHPKECAKN